jgi:hypothetical protein
MLSDILTEALLFIALVWLLLAIITGLDTVQFMAYFFTAAACLNHLTEGKE